MATETKKKKSLKKEEAKKSCIVAIVLDKSGSMQSMRTEAIEAFNEQVKKIKERSDEVNTTVTLVTFSTDVDAPVYFNEPVDKLKELTTEDYEPGGMTAMYDAVGYTINKLKELKATDDADTAVMVLVISDGAENNSKKFRSSDLAELVQSCDKTERWTFTYLGANQDLGKIAETLNIHKGNMRSFSATSDGMRGATIATSCAMDSFYSNVSAGTMTTKSFYSNTGEVAQEEPVGAEKVKPTLEPDELGSALNKLGVFKR